MPAKKTTAAATQAAPASTEAAQGTEHKTVVSLTAKQLDPNQFVSVTNGFNGVLVYKSKRTGETLIWPEFKSEREMSLSELREAKNTSRSHFENNWFMFDDPEVVEYLGVQQFYRFALRVDDFDALLKKTPEEIEKVVSQLSQGQKKSVAYRAKKLIASGEIDSMKTVAVLEKCLGVELIEK
jgi:hypothetical protein